MRCLRRRRRGTFCVPSTRRRRSKKRNSDACPERRPTSRKRARRWRGWVESTGPWSNAWASDVTIIESRKREALATYEGERGYQPMLAVWAEMNVVLADEFRDGNVPAQMAPLSVARAAFAALPKTVKTYYYRGDSAC